MSVVKKTPIQKINKEIDELGRRIASLKKNKCDKQAKAPKKLKNKVKELEKELEECKRGKKFWRKVDGRWVRNDGKKGIEPRRTGKLKL